MPEICNVNDVVDITIKEARVVRVSGNLIYTNSTGVVNVNDPRVRVEVVKQLPTEPGSQIRYTTDRGNVYILTLDASGDWNNQHGVYVHKDTIRSHDFQVRKDEWE